MSDEALAAIGYKPQTLATGNDSVQRLLAESVANPAGAGLLCDTTFGGDDETLSTRTSVKFFADVLKGKVVDRLVRISNTFGNQTECCHLAALGPDGFFLCTCLRLLVHGLGCRHALRAMVEADFDFNGGCIAPRWRDGSMPWTMGPLSAQPAVVATTGTGVPGQLPPAPADLAAYSQAKPTVRAHVYSTCVAFGKELAAMTSDIDTIPGIQRILENLTKQARQLIEVEVRSQQDASTGRVFKGVRARPTSAADLPEGGNVGTGPGGGRGRGKNGGKGKGVSKGRGGTSAGRTGGRGAAGAGAGVSGAGMPSPGVGLPAFQQAAGAGTTSGGEEGGGRGAGVGVSTAGMLTPGVSIPAFQQAAGAGATSGGGGAGGGAGAGVSVAGMPSPGVGILAFQQATGAGATSGGGGGREVGRWCLSRGHAMPPAIPWRWRRPSGLPTGSWR